MERMKVKAKMPSVHVKVKHLASKSCNSDRGCKRRNRYRSKARSFVVVMLLLLLIHFSRVQLCATPQTAAHQAPPSLGFSRQEHWSGLPFPSPMQESEK